MKKISKKLINNFLIKVFGLKLYSVKAHGREDITDIWNSGYTIEKIFDVGANHGQSIDKFTFGFPNAEIFAFEPVNATFKILEEKFSQTPRIKLFQFAFGEQASTQLIYVPEHDTMASLVKPENYKETESVSVNTIDAFCHNSNISSIDLLKVDAEGYDLEVLKGAKSMLRNRKIKLVLVELGFEFDSKHHVLFDLVRDFLSPYNFDLYGIYDQQLDWSGKKKIRFANVCFRLSDVSKD